METKNTKLSSCANMPWWLLVIYFALTFVATYLNSLGITENNITLYIVGAILLWSVFLFIAPTSFKWTLMSIAFFVIWSCILVNKISLDYNTSLSLDSDFSYLRLALWVIIVISVARLCPTFPSFIVNIILWAIFWGLPSEFQSFLVSKNLSSETLTIAIYEITIILLINLAQLTSYLNSIFAKKDLHLSPFRLYFSFINLALLISACIIPNSVFAEISFGVGLALVVSSLLTSALIAMIFSTILDSYRKCIHKVVNEERVAVNDLLFDIDPISLSYDELIEYKNKHVIQVNSQKIQITQLQQKEQGYQDKIITVNALNNMLYGVLAELPLGTLVLALDGSIISVNKKFTELLKTKAPEFLKGANFKALRNDEVWNNDIFIILNNIFEVSDNELQTLKSYQTISTIIENHYLKIDVYINDKLGTIDAQSLKQDKSNNELGVIIVLREEEDTRELQLANLVKTKRTMVEKLALTACEETISNLRGIKEAIDLQKKLIQTARTQETNELIKDAIKAVSFNFNKVFNKISLVPTNYKSEVGEIKTVNLTSALQNTINYILYLSGIEKNIELKNGKEITAQTMAGEEVLKLENIKMELPNVQLNLFLTNFAMLLKGVLNLAPDLEVFLDTDELKPDKINFIPDHANGKFARITISHPGKSITEAMIRNNYVAICKSRKEASELEVSTSLLVNYVKELGGFVTLQTKSHRNTSFCIYLPVNYKGQMEQEKAGSLDYNGNNIYKFSNNYDVPHILIIGSKYRINQSIRRMLVGLGAKVAIEDYNAILRNQNEVLEFSGQGLGDPDEGAGINFVPKTMVSHVIISLDEDSELNDIDYMLIKEKIPGVKISVITWEKSKADEINERSAGIVNAIFKPVSLDMLKQILKQNAVSNSNYSSEEQESTV
ncbi:MAG: hypothetical protein LBE20_07175 [Deltaproteobacteria bacterium]|jgi:PAS domain-containing protein|nr:hypothetical protein [Deltaproteobacteria bacterium]